MFFRRALPFVGIIAALGISKVSNAGHITPITSPITSDYSENFEGFSVNELNHHVFSQNEVVFNGQAKMSWNSTVDPFRDPSGLDGGLYPSPPINTVRTFIDYAAGASDPGDLWGTGRAPTGPSNSSYWVPDRYKATSPTLNRYSVGVGNYNYDPSGVSSPPLTFTFEPSAQVTTFGGYFGAAGELFNMRLRFYDVNGNVIDGVRNAADTYYIGGEQIVQFAYQDTGIDWRFRWVGFQSEVVIGKVELDGNAWVMDNLVAGKTTVVPEPASMIALGLGVTALLRRRRSSK